MQNQGKQGTHWTVPCTPWLHAHLTQNTMLLTKSWYQELIVKTLAHNSQTENMKIYFGTKIVHKRTQQVW